jgi:acyl-CoA thioesterase-1
MPRFQPLAALLTALSLCFGIAVAEAQTTPAVKAPVEIVALGDSLSAGFGVGPGESFPEQLQAALAVKGYSVVVANAGVSGDTTTGGLARLDWSVPDTAKLVIVELGANDALRGIAPAISERNLDAILKRLQERKIPALLAGMIAPPNMGPDYAAAFNPIYAKLAERYGVALYPFFLDGSAGEASLTQADGMHPNPKGVAVIVERILPSVTKALDALQAG